MDFLKIAGNNELFVLFHGTGGNDLSLLEVTEIINPNASVISFLGNVGTGINRRFFAPLNFGKVDREDLDYRTEEFMNIWNDMDLENKFENITFIGYSNGANFILALLEKNPDIAHNTILLHPSELGWKLKKSATKNRIIATVAAKDGIAPPGYIIRLVKELKENNILNIETILGDNGHEISKEEIEQVKKWLENNK